MRSPLGRTFARRVLHVSQAEGRRSRCRHVLRGCHGTTCARSGTHRGAPVSLRGCALGLSWDHVCGTWKWHGRKWKHVCCQNQHLAVCTTTRSGSDGVLLLFNQLKCSVASRGVVCGELLWYVTESASRAPPAPVDHLSEPKPCDDAWEISFEEGFGFLGHSDPLLELPEVPQGSLETSCGTAATFHEEHYRAADVWLDMSMTRDCWSAVSEWIGRPRPLLRVGLPSVRRWDARVPDSV